MDMPDTCRDCPCLNCLYFGAFCGVTDNEIEYDYDSFAYVKPNWCPLKKAPKEKDWSEVPYETDCSSYLKGWNGCLDKILENN